MIADFVSTSTHSEEGVAKTLDYCEERLGLSIAILFVFSVLQNVVTVKLSNKLITMLHRLSIIISNYPFRDVPVGAEVIGQLHFHASSSALRHEL